jgi:DNA-binding CsgD family transcriptional regulator
LGPVVVPQSEIVGRDAELAEVEEFLANPRFPTGLLLDGEAGIGKTTLWRHAIARAEERGLRVLSCTAASAEAQLAFTALGDLLDGSLEGLLIDLPVPQRTALEVALLLAEGDVAPDPQAVARALLGSIRRLARDGGVVIAIDDVQWLDAGSREALKFAVRRLRNDTVLLVLARRVTADEAPLPLELERAAWREPLQLLDVGPLSVGAVQRLILQRLDLAFPRPALLRLHEISGGNPFFALELARALERSGGRIAAGEALPVPRRLQDLVRDRLEALPQEALEHVQVAAALARPTVGLLAAASHSDPDGLHVAAEAGVVEIDGERVRFTHPLLASTAYTMLDRTEKRGLHERLARLVEDPEERMRHLALVAESPDESVARELDAAAERARARGARAGAAELLEHAARLTPAGLPLDRRRRIRDAAYLHFESGDTLRGRAMLESLVAELSPGPERASVLVRLGLTRAYDDDLHAATDLFLQAEHEAEENARLRGEALNNVASMLFRRRERLSEAIEYAKTAVALARQAGDRHLIADALGQQILAEATLGRPEAHATVDEALALQPENEDARLLSQPKWIVAIARMWWEDLEYAERTYAELIARGHESGEDGLVPYVYILAAQNDCLLGKFGRAGTHAQSGLELAEQAGEETLASYALALRAFADAHRGEVAAAREASERALEVGRRTRGTPTLFFASAAAGLLALSLGQPREAAEHLQRTVSFARDEQIAEPGSTRFAIDYAESLIELGRLDEADDVTAWYESHARRLGRHGALASALRCKGLSIASRGDLDLALATFGEALAEHRMSLLPFDQARTLLAQGATFRRAKQKRLARETLAQARDEFDRLGARLWVDRSEAELARVSGRKPTEAVLTSTELRVADLAAGGLSTKAVAAALFVSPKTVEGHLSKIYAKLGIHSRAELGDALSRERSDS